MRISLRGILIGTAIVAAYCYAWSSTLRLDFAQTPRGLAIIVLLPITFIGCLTALNLLRQRQVVGRVSLNLGPRFSASNHLVTAVVATAISLVFTKPSDAVPELAVFVLTCAAMVHINQLITPRLILGTKGISTGSAHFRWKDARIEIWRESTRPLLRLRGQYWYSSTGCASLPTRHLTEVISEIERRHPGEHVLSSDKLHG